jgi:hypothetical protein
MDLMYLPWYPIIVIHLHIIWLSIEKDQRMMFQCRERDEELHTRMGQYNIVNEGFKAFLVSCKKI